MSRLVIERGKGAYGYDWDVLVDGLRVDSLMRPGSRVTVERDHAFVGFVRTTDQTDGGINELRIPVAAGQNKRVAVRLRFPLLGGSLEAQVI
jgi:hypothetical protein